MGYTAFTWEGIRNIVLLVFCHCALQPLAVKRPVTRDKIISPRSQWEECICPVCDELMNDPVLTSCGHQMCYECFNKSRWDIW